MTYRTTRSALLGSALWIITACDPGFVVRLAPAPHSDSLIFRVSTTRDTTRATSALRELSVRSCDDSVDLWRIIRRDSAPPNRTFAIQYGVQPDSNWRTSQPARPLGDGCYWAAAEGFAIPNGRRFTIVGAAVKDSAPFPPKTQPLRPIVFTDRGRLCSVGPPDTARVCLPEAREFGDVAWHPDGTRLVTDRGVFLDARGERIGVIAGFHGIRPVWSPSGEYLYAIDYDAGSAVRRWNQQGTSPATIPVEGGATVGRRFQMLAFSPNGRRAALLTMEFREMVIADVQPERFVVSRTAPIGFDYVSQAVWLNDDALLFVGKRAGNQFGALWRLNVVTGATDSVGIPGLALRDQIVIAPDRKSVAATATSTTGTTRWNVWCFDLTTRAVRQVSFGTEDIVLSWR